MKLDTIFQVSIYLLITISASTLCLTEEGLIPAGLTLPMAILAFALNERWRMVRISALWTNLMGLAALTFCGFESLQGSPLSRLLAGSHLLVIMSWIVMFQDKKVRHYWWLLALSVLQIAAGSILTTSGWFGFLLLVYVGLGIYTLTVFLLYRGDTHFGHWERDAAPIAGARFASRSNSRDTPARPSGGTWRAMLPPWARSQARSNVLPHAPRVRSRAWGELSHAQAPRQLVPALPFTVMPLFAASIACGFGFFLVVPRVWSGNLNALLHNSGRVGPARALSGFSPEVHLGDMGEILENPARVMRVRVFRHRSDDPAVADEPVSLKDFGFHYGLTEPLFRGTVLNTYKQGHWTAISSQNRHLMPSRPRKAGMFRQEIVLEPIGTDVIFAMRPLRLAYLKSHYDYVTKTSETGVLSTGRGGTREAVEYRIFSEPIPFESGQTRRPHDDLLGWDAMKPSTQPRYLQLPATGLERLTALARGLTVPEKLGLDLGSSSLEMSMARALEGHLRDSGQYTYSLNASIQDARIDPIEDFLFNRRSGHCEYYASALALMLRAVGIPARVVNGFKGGILNEISGYTEVQQRHAHAWVEAFLEGDWVTLDATPGNREDLAGGGGTGPSFWQKTQSVMSTLWNRYVVTVTYSQQEQSVYEPLQRFARDNWTSWDEGDESLTHWVETLRKQLGKPAEAWTGSTMLLLIGLAAAGGLLAWLAPWRHFLKRRGLRTVGRARRPSPTVEFFELFLKMMAARGWTPRVAETPREFAARVQSELQSHPDAADVLEGPRAVTESFYAVRYGGIPLTGAEQSRITLLLHRLEAALARPSNGGTTRPARTVAG